VIPPVVPPVIPPQNPPIDLPPVAGTPNEVPEPLTIALMLAGLVLMGMVLRKRS
jgi:hypothetical protein